AGSAGASAPPDRASRGRRARTLGARMRTRRGRRAGHRRRPPPSAGVAGPPARPARPTTAGPRGPLPSSVRSSWCPVPVSVGVLGEERVGLLGGGVERLLHRLLTADGGADLLLEECVDPRPGRRHGTRLRRRELLD